MRNRLFQAIIPPPVRKSKWWRRKVNGVETVHEGQFMFVRGQVIAFDSVQEAKEWARGKRR